MSRPERDPLLRPPRVVSAAALVSSFDRFAVSPLLVPIAASLGVGLAQALAVASSYYLAYGLSQPLWGALSDRFGRVRLMRLALLASAVAGVASAAAPGLGWLIAARVLTGAFFGAIVPTSLTYVGDTVPVSHRQSALADLMAAIAIGTATATAVAGLVVQVADWRLVFAATAVPAACCAVAMRRLPEPRREPPGGVLATLAGSLADRWVLAVITLAFVEGAVVLGVLTLLAPALQARGVGAGAAGVAITAYGVSVVVSTRVLRAVSGRLPMPLLLTIGGLAAAGGYAVLIASVGVVTVVAAAGCLGVTWAFMHSSLQTWITTVRPQARGTVVSLFAGALFAGSAAGAWLAGILAAEGRWSLLFAATTAVALVLTVAAVASRRRYETLPPTR